MFDRSVTFRRSSTFFFFASPLLGDGGPLTSGFLLEAARTGFGGLMEVVWLFVSARSIDGKCRTCSSSDRTTGVA